MKRPLCVWLGFCLAGIASAQSYNELVERAMDYTLKDSLQQAEVLFQQALKMDPSNARNALLFSNLGTVQKRMGKNKEVIESYTLALNITPYSTAMLLNRAALYLEMGLLDKAYVDYCNVIDLIPENLEARLFRAYIYMDRRQYKEARIDYNTILATDFKHREARLGLAVLNQKEGKYTAALDLLNLLVTDFPEDTSCLKMRANIELEQGQGEMALLDLQKVMQLDPKDTDACLVIGDVLLQLKRKSEARKAYEQAVELGVPRAEVMEKLKQCR